ncbi:hypothetical protein ACJX0J_020851, partial [Zea mays]
EDSEDKAFIQFITMTHSLALVAKDILLVSNALLVGQQENQQGTLQEKHRQGCLTLWCFRFLGCDNSPDATHISQKIEMLDNRWASKEMIVVPLILYWEDDLQSTSLQEDNCSWFPYSLSRGGDSAIGLVVCRQL